MEGDPFESLLEQASVDDLKEQQQRYLEQAEELRLRADAIGQLLAIRSRLHPDPKGGRGADSADLLAEVIREYQRPGVTEGILRIMREGSASSVWSAQTLLGHMAARGWPPRGKTPANSIAATLSRLHRDGLVERAVRGTYRLTTKGWQGSEPADTGTEQQRLVEGEGVNP